MKPAAQPMSDLLRRLEEVTRECVRHGHSDFTIVCKTLSRGDREVVIRAGKNYRFVIEENDLDH